MNLKELITILQKEDYVFIQSHNFPDHDSVAAAFGLQHFFSHFDITSYITYDGEIQRESLRRMIKELNIEIKHISHYYMSEGHKIVIVDGCKGHKNVTDLIGEEIGIIDHHLTISPESVPYSDIRSDYGACSSIIFNYFTEHQKMIDRNVASALLIGINMDTALLTRGVVDADLEAFSNLYMISDIERVNSILRNYIEIDDLFYYKEAINRTHYHREMSFCYLPQGCSQNLVGILADFFLALKEIDFVVICAKNGNIINFSVRNENPSWNASAIIQEVLKGVGFGGGHRDLAGGIVKDIDLFDEKDIFNRFVRIIYDYEQFR